MLIIQVCDTIINGNRIVFHDVVDINSLKVLSTSLPGRYAVALFREGKKANCLDKIVENFQSMSSFFEKNPNLKKLLTSNCLSKKDIATGWIALGKRLSFCPVFLAMMRNVVLNKRFNIINMIRYVFNVAFAKYKNKRNAVVSSAVELLPEQKKLIERLIGKIFDEKVMLTYKINEDLLGGIKISSEELMIDASARAQVKQIVDFMKAIKIKVDKNEN